MPKSLLEQLTEKELAEAMIRKGKPQYAKWILGFGALIAGGVIALVVIGAFRKKEGSGRKGTLWDKFLALFTEEKETEEAIVEAGGEIGDIEAAWEEAAILNEADRIRGLIETKQSELTVQYSLIENSEDQMQVCVTGKLAQVREIEAATKVTVGDWFAWIFTAGIGAAATEIARADRKKKAEAEIEKWKEQFYIYQTNWEAQIDDYGALLLELQVLEGEMIVFNPSYQPTAQNYEIDWANDPAHAVWAGDFDSVYEERKEFGEE